MTDQPDLLLARPAVSGAATIGACDPADVLSEVLRSVRLTGAMLFQVHANTPWKSHAPSARRFAHVMLPAAEHLVSYHVVTHGRCVAGLRDGLVQTLQAGDVLVVPHGDPYFLASAADVPASYSDDDAVAFFRCMSAGELGYTVQEGGAGTGAESTRFICGFLGCNALPFNPVVAALPPVIHWQRSPQSGDRLQPLIAMALEELAQPRAGSREVLLRLSEMMFIEVVRGQLSRGGDVAKGWLAGLRDPLVARMLVLMHHDLARPWTLDALAAAVGSSRTVLVERFVELVGQPPMRYLNAWRMQRAAQLLSEGHAKVHAVAQSVGYASEAAFSRAFKRHAGVSPGAWRPQ